ncbi:nuclear transport factor 2 family protein [Brevibacterium sp.]|uniref:YybH family protein n=1 Tax=Brevibacterium sp. TaxID=1701 RepID=UPI002647A540|nr:nuclear transport factor 2 family protein [Brevibacterium sp.]MDN6605501.1 nuclear transport factor 2 family protein [Brevibacterium sp.]
MPNDVNEPSRAEVDRAADAIVDAFATTDTKAYFAAFGPDASFIFHPEGRRFDSRAEFEEIWNSWLSDGWPVADCVSSNRLVQTFPGGAVFSHTVETPVTTADGTQSYRERESIIFCHLGEGNLVAIHEHLSTVPDAGDADAAADVVSTGTEAVAQ